VFSLYNPGIITIPIGFVGAYLGTILSRRQSQSIAEFNEFYIHSQSGIASRGEKKWKA
jgi:cation/acetate symporter